MSLSKLRYFDNSKIVRYKPRNKEDIYEIEIIKDAKNRLSKNKKVLNDLRNVSQSAGQDPENYVINWFNLADVLVVIRKGDIICGFTIAYFSKFNLIHFPVTMITTEFQNTGLGLFITTKALKEFLFWRIKEVNFKIWKLYSPAYFIFRTQNPVLYTMLSNKTIIFPSILEKRKPFLKEKKMAEEFAKKFWPTCDFDSSTFVLKNAYASNPKLMPDVDKILWSRNKIINEYFEEHLGLTAKEGHALLVLGKILFFRQFMNILIF